MPTPTDRPPTRPPRTPRRALTGRPPSPPDPVLQQRAWAALALGMLSLIGLSLAGSLRRAVYIVIAALVLGALAAWLGGTAMSRARRAGSARPRGAIAGTILGVLGLSFSAIALIVFAIVLERAVGLLELPQRGQHADRPAGLPAAVQPHHHQPDPVPAARGLISRGRGRGLRPTDPGRYGARRRRQSRRPAPARGSRPHGPPRPGPGTPRPPRRIAIRRRCASA